MSRNFFPFLLAFPLILGVGWTSMVASSQRVCADDVTSQEGSLLQDEIRSLRAAVEHMRSLQREGGYAPPTDVGDGEGGGRPDYMGDNSGASSQGDLVVQLMERVKTLEQHDRELHGALDQQTHELTERLNMLDKRVGDMNFASRTKGLKLHNNEPVKATVPTRDKLNDARNALKSHDFATAQQEASSYLDTKGPRKIEAKLLLGQALSGQKEYRQAAVAYFDAYHLSPKTITAPQALLGVTSSLMALGNDKAACQALDKIRSEFPKPSLWVNRAINVDAQKAKCGYAPN